MISSNSSSSSPPGHEQVRSGEHRAGRRRQQAQAQRPGAPVPSEESGTGVDLDPRPPALRLTELGLPTA